jgi:hypothetical protein
MSPDRKGLIKIISTRYFLVIKEINKYLVDMILINKKNLSGRAGLCHTKFWTLMLIYVRRIKKSSQFKK